MKFFASLKAHFSYYPASLEETLNSYVPQKTEFELVRLGGEGDGAYLIPDDLADIDEVISLGCGQNIQFEQDFFNRTGIKSFIIDSAESFPENFKDTPHTFLQGWVGDSVLPPHPQLPIYNLPSLLNSIGKESLLNGILKIDIESSEYSLLLSTNLETFLQFRIIIIEFHRLNELKTSSIFCRLLDEIMRKFAREFVICHVHPNNSVNYFQVKQILFPSCLEVTFLRKDRTKTNYPSYGEYPKVLDVKNNASKATVPITFPIRLA